MLLLTDFATYADYRSTLGVMEQELPDSLLSTEKFSNLLKLSFDDVNSGITTLYSTVSALPAITRTTEQERFYAVSRLFAIYSVCYNLLGSLPLFAPKMITDGKAKHDRFPDAFAEIKEGIILGYQAMRKRLADAYATLDPSYTAPTATVMTLVKGVGLALSPITNT